MAQMGSIVALYFRDNVYQGWAKGSQFAQGQQQAKFHNAQDEYAALLNIIALPDLRTQLSDGSLHTEVLLPNVNLTAPHIYFGVYVVGNTETLGPSSVASNLTGRLNTSTYHVAYAVKPEPKQIYDVNSRGLVGLRLDLSQSQVKAALCEAVIAFAQWLKSHNNQQYPTMAAAISAAIAAFGDIHSGLFQRLFGTHQCFGLYACARIQEGDIHIPNSLIQQVADVKPTQEKTAFDQLIQGNHHYLDKLRLTEIYHGQKQLADDVKEYWATNPSVNLIKVEPYS